MNAAALPYGLGRPPTTAAVKLARLVEAAGSVTALARRVGSQANTIRLLLAGVTSVKSATVERFRPEGINPDDWYTSASIVPSVNPMSDASAF